MDEEEPVQVLKGQPCHQSELPGLRFPPERSKQCIYPRRVFLAEQFIKPRPVFLGELGKQVWRSLCLIRPAPLRCEHMTPAYSGAAVVGRRPDPAHTRVVRRLPGLRPGLPPLPYLVLDSSLRLFVPLCLTGEALMVIGRLDSNTALDYDQLKATLLQRFRCTAEGYRKKFRTARTEDHETGLQYAGRI
ncbi:hypothetical protein HPB49_008937 [Dermacentor silvarum]|uniref:Uncharacterized protein n=1 Tax=Dermacentor silvarum TaxID=543639 RepID=A0ACB8D439_DERSI|nr:hypothetical protein HPB49_008937 [Dermacentor silvarum]